MKTAVITFPGSNCDDDVKYVLESVCRNEVVSIWHKEGTSLAGYDLVVLPGGFSYGDYLRCGAMAAQSAVLQAVAEFANSGGWVIGVCNGFQILCEAGLLPGALAKNASLSFVCRDVWLKVENNTTAWTGAFTENECVQWPIAHGEGRYVVSDEEYAKLTANRQILFSYTDATGKKTDAANPNGSVHAIAGVCNEKGNVFGLMPHPERASDLRSLHGMKLWNSIAQANSRRSQT